MTPPTSDVFSFEADMEGWGCGGTDLEIDGTTIAWDIGQTRDYASAGEASVRLYLDNRNDAGKIWMERGFVATPGSSYIVTVAFVFASREWCGSANTWALIAGAVSTPPTSRDDVVPLVRGDTCNGMQENVGYVWHSQKHESVVKAEADGMIWVLIGVWGTWECPRTYYVDTVEVSFTPE